MPSGLRESILLVIRSNRDPGLFIDSGLFHALTQEFDVHCIFEPAFESETPSPAVSRYVEARLHEPSRTLATKAVDGIRRRLYGSLGLESWMNFGEVSDAKPKAADSRLRVLWLVCASLILLERLILRRSGQVNRLLRLVDRFGAKAVLFADDLSSRSRLIAYAAIRRRIRAICILPTAKDAWVCPLPLVPLKVVAQSSAASSHLLRLPAWSMANDVLTIRPLALEALDRATPEGRMQFCRRYGFDPHQPIVCISASSPLAAPNEFDLITEIIGHALELPSDAQYLIRTNPMDDHSIAWSQLSVEGRVAVQRPLWRYDPDRMISEPLAEDLVLWKSTLAHCALNISAPSMVTADFLHHGKKVINFNFGKDGARYVQSYESPWYESFRVHPDCLLATSLHDLRNFIEISLCVATRSPNPEAEPSSLSIADWSRRLLCT